MLLRDTAKFEGLASKPGLLFFAQRFEEATFDYSLDSHRAPAVNIPSLIYEAHAQVGRVIREEPGVSEASVEPIVEELCDRLGDSAIFKSMFVPERDVISRLSSPDRPQKASKRLDNLLQKSTLPRGPDAARFKSISEFHSMSLDAASPQNQLLNLWISLETLAPSRPGKNKIEDVIAAVTPSIGLAYVRRLFERASFDLLRWDRREVSRSLQAVGEGDWSIPQRVLFLLTHSSTEALLEQLFEKMGDFELLRYRCFVLRSEFRDRNSALEKIKSHQERVVWQLRRIYRARNLVVHQGSSPPWLRSVIETAHEYFDQALDSSNVFSCGSSGFKTYAKVFNYAHMEFEAYLRRLNDQSVTEDEFRHRLIWARPKYATRADVLIGAPE